MVKTIADSWMEEGVEKGRVEGGLNTARVILLGLLEDKFGQLQDDLVQRIKAVSDPAKLAQAARQTLRLDKLEDLQL
jgi:hypothetical protein